MYERELLKKWKAVLDAAGGFKQVDRLPAAHVLESLQKDWCEEKHMYGVIIIPTNVRLMQDIANNLSFMDITWGGDDLPILHTVDTSIASEEELKRLNHSTMYGISASCEMCDIISWDIIHSLMLKVYDNTRMDEIALCHDDITEYDYIIISEECYKKYDYMFSAVEASKHYFGVSHVGRFRGLDLYLDCTKSHDFSHVLGKRGDIDYTMSVPMYTDDFLFSIHHKGEFKANNKLVMVK
jgi:hypothetical protein